MLPCGFVDVKRFLAGVPPFEGLDGPGLERIVRATQIEFFPAGTTILEQAGEPAKFLHVIRSGAVEFLSEGRLVDLSGEGEVFGELSLLGSFGPTATVRAHEDTICYLIDRDIAEAALGTPHGLAFVAASMRRRTRRAEDALEGSRVDLRHVPVGSLLRRPPVTFPSEGTVRDAATLMAEQRISSILIPRGSWWGIMTDRDLRSRVLAPGRPLETLVGEVMSFPASSVAPEAMASEVLLRMLEGGFHHFPVVDSGGALVGVVTDTDLMGLERQSPFALKSSIERARDEEATVAAARTLPQTVCALVEASVDPVDIGHVVGVTIDTLTRKLIELAIDRMGEPPVPWAWLALGSEARHEQALHTDQDHALAYDPQGRPVGEIDPYFAELAEAVTAGLEAAGIPRCKGDAMAYNEALRRSVDGWVAAFKRWMNDPGFEGSVLTSIVFDYRQIAGPLEVEPALDDVIRAASAGYPQFLRHLARRALDHRPPTGFFRDLVVEARATTPAVWTSSMAESSSSRTWPAPMRSARAGPSDARSTGSVERPPPARSPKRRGNRWKRPSGFSGRRDWSTRRPAFEVGRPPTTSSTRRRSARSPGGASRRPSASSPASSARSPRTSGSGDAASACRPGPAQPAPPLD